MERLLPLADLDTVVGVVVVVDDEDEDEADEDFLAAACSLSRCCCCCCFSWASRASAMSSASRWSTSGVERRASKRLSSLVLVLVVSR